MENISNRTLTARVIMLPDGSTHIALFGGATLECTLGRLAALLRDPRAFLQSGQLSHHVNTSKINPEGTDDLMQLRGLTLVKVFGAEVYVVFPTLLDSLFEHYGEEPERPVNLTEYVKNQTLSDEKHFLLKFFYDFTNTKAQELKANKKFGVNFEAQSEVIKETLVTAFGLITTEEATRKTKAARKQKQNITAVTAERASSVPANDSLPTIESNCTFPNNRNGSNSPPASNTKKTIHLDRYINSKNKPEQITTDDDVFIEDFLPYVSLRQYADITGESLQRIYTARVQKRLRGAIKVNGRWYVHKDLPFPEYQRQPKEAHSFEPFLRKNGGNHYYAAQEYMKEYNVVSDHVRKFIRTRPEFMFYVNHDYYEVDWGNGRALVVDIDMDFIFEGKSNRERILDNQTPYCRITDDYCSPFHIHHIGQKINSPFATICEEYHSTCSKIFHQAKNKEWSPDGEEDLHGRTFQILKDNFWQWYLKTYDAGGFQNFPIVKKVQLEYENAKKGKR